MSISLSDPLPSLSNVRTTAPLPVVSPAALSERFPLSAAVASQIARYRAEAIDLVEGASDRLLVGIDLRKDRRALERAYDDDAGVTARFNLNLLARINRELGGRFELAHFAHEAVWREPEGRVELSLVSEVL